MFSFVLEQVRQDNRSAGRGVLWFVNARRSLIIGAGQAGLAVSRCLQKRNVPHAVIERGRIGNTWRPTSPRGALPGVAER